MKRGGYFKLAFLTAAASLMPLESSWAHRPIFEKSDAENFDRAIVIQEPRISYAIYGGLEFEGDVDYYRFDLESPEKLHIGLIVPRLPEYEDFFPLYALVGPGLPPPAGPLPFEIPKGCGAIISPGPAGGKRPVFHEPFSWTYYYRGIPYIEFNAEQPGTYHIVVWHPESEKGSYVVSFGKKEKWGPGDIRKLYKDIKYIRSGKWIIKKN